MQAAREMLRLRFTGRRDRRDRRRFEPSGDLMPFRLVRTEEKVRITVRTVDIFRRSLLVATHLRNQHADQPGVA